MDSCELFSRWQKRARSCTVGKSSVSACNVALYKRASHVSRHWMQV